MTTKFGSNLFVFNEDVSSVVDLRVNRRSVADKRTLQNLQRRNGQHILVNQWKIASTVVNTHADEEDEYGEEAEPGEEVRHGRRGALLRLPEHVLQPRDKHRQSGHKGHVLL